jgi:hypothetical protein
MVLMVVAGSSQAACDCRSDAGGSEENVDLRFSAK